MGKKSNYSKFLHNILEEPYENATHKFQAIYMNFVASIFFSSNFSKHFLSTFIPKTLDFVSKILKSDNTNWQTYGNQVSLT